MIIGFVGCIWPRCCSNLVNVDSNDIRIIHVAWLQSTFPSQISCPSIRLLFFLLCSFGQVCYGRDISDLEGLGGMWRQAIHVEFSCLEEPSFMVECKVYWFLGIVLNFTPLSHRASSHLFSFSFLFLLSFDLIPLLFSFFNDSAKMHKIIVD